MNNFQYPLPVIFNNYNIFEEINLLKKRIEILEEKITSLENKDETDYLKNDDNYYMI